MSAAAGVALCIALRLPWFDAPLGRDEGGVSLVAAAWHRSHPFPYGPYFLDRPPLLVLLYRLAGDPAGVRVLGMIAAALAVVVCTALGARVAGPRAALPAALLAAALTSSTAIDAVFTPAELLAVVPSALSVLLLLSGLSGDTPAAARRLAGAGAMATAALLVKQSFGDALAAGLVGLAVAAAGTPWRRTATRVAAYLGGGAALALAIGIWDLAANLSGSGPGSLLYAFAGFRLDAVQPLASGDLAARTSAIGAAAAGSGMVLATLLAIAGILTLRRHRVTAGVLGAWLLAGLLGVLGGGSYWSHYLIELVPVTAVGVAALVARRPRVGAALGSIALAIAMGTSLDQAALGRPEQYQRSAVVVGDYLRARALRGDSAYVLYAKVNALYYSGLPSPFPYEWSLMMVSVPNVEQQLRALLLSPRRPTWVVMAQPTRAFGLDRSGATARVLRREYRRGGRVCGIRILLARSAGTRPRASGLPRCRVVAERLDVDL